MFDSWKKKTKNKNKNLQNIRNQIQNKCYKIILMIRVVKSVSTVAPESLQKYKYIYNKA